MSRVFAWWLVVSALPSGLVLKLSASFRFVLFPFLSESSFFVFPNKLIMKTCGTTLNLLGLPRILAIAKEYSGLESVWRCFYSRKSFMFPDRQKGPHKGGWETEVDFLDDIFGRFQPAGGRARIDGLDATCKQAESAPVPLLITCRPSFLSCYPDSSISLLLQTMALPTLLGR